MWNADHFFGMRLCAIEGGSVRNAIPREAFAIVTIPNQFEKDFITSVSSFLKMYREELAGVEPDLNFIAESVSLPEFWIEKSTQEHLLDSLYAMPNGVIRMVSEMPDVVETSTNLAIVKSTESQIEVMCLLRSAVESAKKDLGNMIESIFDMANATTVLDGEYPGWKPNFNSPLLQIMKDTQKKLTGKDPIVKVIHAGLECGLIGDVFPNMEMVSFGPTILNPHSPDEKVNIPSVGKFWKYLTEMLKAISEK
jgi:dipeptidase D